MKIIKLEEKNGNVIKLKKKVKFTYFACNFWKRIFTNKIGLHIFYENIITFWLLHRLREQKTIAN